MDAKWGHIQVLNLVGGFNLQGGAPQNVINWCINPINYRYITYKP